MGYYQPVFEKLYFDDYPKRSRDLDQLKALAAGYGDLRAFVDDTALDPPESEAAGESGHRLVLSTIHSAKGLEWTVVFVIGLAVGRFPGQYVLPPGEQWEEERRLFYVAATRAKKRLFLSFPREMFNSGQRVYAGMSSFVAELKPVLYQTVTVEQQGPARAGAGAPRADAVPEPGPTSAAFCGMDQRSSPRTRPSKPSSFRRRSAVPDRDSGAFPMRPSRRSRTACPSA